MLKSNIEPLNWTQKYNYKPMPDECLLINETQNDDKSWLSDHFWRRFSGVRQCADQFSVGVGAGSVVGVSSGLMPYDWRVLLLQLVGSALGLRWRGLGTCQVRRRHARPHQGRRWRCGKRDIIWNCQLKSGKGHTIEQRGSPFRLPRDLTLSSIHSWQAFRLFSASTTY